MTTTNNSNDNSKKQMAKAPNYVSRETKKTLEQLKSLQKQYLLMCVSHDAEMMGLVELLDKVRKSWKRSEDENAELKDTIARIQGGDGNLGVAEHQRLVQKVRDCEDQIAVLMSTNAVLQGEVDAYKRCFKTANLGKMVDAYGSETTEDRFNEGPVELPYFESLAPVQEHKSTYSQETPTPPASIQPPTITIHQSTFRRGRESITTPKTSHVRRSQSLQPVSRPSPPQISEKMRVDFTGESDDQPCVETDEGTQENSDCMTPTNQPGSYDMRATPASGKLLLGQEDKTTTHQYALRRSVSVNLDEKPVLALKSPSIVEMQSPALAGFGPSWTKGRKIEECFHDFDKGRSLFTSCGVCQKWIGWSGLHCKSCKLIVHDCCEPNAPMPCIPFVTVIQNSKVRPRIADFCPKTRPKIPGLIIRCVMVIDTMHLGQKGLYRCPANATMVDKLLQSLITTRYTPNLHSCSSDILTGVIKTFLEQLREPLIPTTSYKEMVTAVEKKNVDQLMMVVADLPFPNRDTLAYLFVHWQKVASRSGDNQMPVPNLAKYLSFTVIRLMDKFGNPPAQQHEENARRANVFAHLLNLDPDFWKALVKGQQPIKSSPSLLSQIGATPYGSKTPAPRTTFYSAMPY